MVLPRAADDRRKARHTPAPWLADDADFAVFDEAGAIVATAVDGTRDNGTRIRCAEQEANLLLIASAPELLESCMQALDWADAQDEELQPDWVKQMSDAVLRATS